MKLSTTSFLLLLVGAILASCQHVSIHPDTPAPDPYGPHDDLIAGLTLRFGSVRTRADVVEVLDGETDIQSIACFVRTKDFGKPGEPTYRQGVFQSFFFKDDEITDEGNGSFSIDLDIQSPSVAGKTDIAVIANYRENGLETALQQVAQWHELFEQVSAPVTAAGIRSPLLMFGYKEVALSHTVETTVTLPVQRLVARFDIENKAADAAKRPFLLKSAEIIHPKQYSFLIGGNDEAYNIPVFDGHFQAVDCADNKNIKGLYTYETANDGSVAHTALLIRGTLDGKAYSKRIDLMQDGEIIALARNTRYAITLTPAADGQGVDWSFTVDDWSEGTVIPVKPDYQQPILGNFTFEDDKGALTTANTWQEDTRTALLKQIAAGYKIRFTVDSPQNTRVSISFPEGTWAQMGITTDAEKQAFVQRSASASNGLLIQEEYVIEFPAFIDEFVAEVRVESATNPRYFETFRLVSNPTYLCVLEDAWMESATGVRIEDGWNNSTRTFRLDDKPKNKIRFTVKSTGNANVSLQPVSGNINALGVTETDIRLVSQRTTGDYTVQEFELGFPAAIMEDVQAKLIISSSNNPLGYDIVIVLDNLPGRYGDDGLAGVRFGTTYWAPLNLGATTTDNTNPSTASTGYFYQFGRNTPFTQYPAPAIEEGPVGWDKRHTTIFYYTPEIASKYDWVRDYGNERATRDAFWLSPANTPCPQGWRLPTRTEVLQFVSATKSNYALETEQKRWRFTGDDGKTLYIPQTGWINYKDGTVKSPEEPQTRLWACEAYLGRYNYAYVLLLEGSDKIQNNNIVAAQGNAVRCVKRVGD
ncbi:hypothetical protein [Parabacteroides sp. PF5-6]|uniref:hypothetical protein n=1 Tax=Parabacteroides sp. PF5-6 TaxID=1742403 RepID=UPI002404F3D8|nr:hypothetical protein [Parabacteroides sp. PF5-6]MDF9831249.1 uncharacterized protein (TIGR02145 family) [Parabacteroides sp. PF5-6]